MKLSHANFFTSILASFIFSPAFALESDTRQPIDVLSNKQTLDLENNQAIFSENVLMTQGSIKINAAKVVINRPKEKQKSETLDAYGSPVTFQQTLDDGKVVEGKGNHVHYDISRERIVLEEQASLRQAKSHIEGREITYDVKKQQLNANGSGQKRVRTVLIPGQLTQGKSSTISIQTVDKPQQTFNTHAPLTQLEGIQSLHKKRLAEKEQQ